MTCGLYSWPKSVIQHENMWKLPKNVFQKNKQKKKNGKTKKKRKKKKKKKKKNLETRIQGRYRFEELSLLSHKEGKGDIINL